MAKNSPITCTITTYWYKTQLNGRWQARGLGMVQSIVVDRDRRTGRGKTKWAGYLESGVLVEGDFDSRQKAMAAVQALAEELAKADAAVKN